MLSKGLQTSLHTMKGVLSTCLKKTQPYLEIIRTLTKIYMFTVPGRAQWCASSNGKHFTCELSTCAAMSAWGLQNKG